MTLMFKDAIVFYSSLLMALTFNDAIVFYSRLPGGAVTVTHSHTVTATASKPRCTFGGFGLRSSVHIQTATRVHTVRAHSQLNTL